MLVGHKIPFKYVYNKVHKDVLRVVAVSVVFHFLKVYAASYLPQIPIQFPSFLGTSITLLLAFNLNQSYDRWWEARKIWGSIVNDSRTLVLQLQAFAVPLAPEQAPLIRELVRRMALRQIAWCYSLGQSLRARTPALPEGGDLLSGEDAAFANRQKNKPYGLLQLHMSDLRALFERGALNPYQQVQLDNTIVRLCDAMGRAERIKSTMFPATYRMFIHFFIYLFLVILSISLVESVGIYEIPILTLVASTFFLIEKTARHMQDPFEDRPTDIAMNAISRTIEINIREILEEPGVPEPAKPDGFYLM